MRKTLTHLCDDSVCRQCRSAIHRFPFPRIPRFGRSWSSASMLSTRELESWWALSSRRGAIVAYGSLNQGDPRPLNGDTIFEIGSVTKVFTSLLLSDMVQRGEVALADPVAKYLPADVKVPERGGRVITLVDLSTHTSGLPRLPIQPSSQRSRQSVCGLYGGATLSIPLILSTDARHRLAV